MQLSEANRLSALRNFKNHLLQLVSLYSLVKTVVRIKLPA